MQAQHVELFAALTLETGLYEWIEARDFFDGLVPGGGIVVGKRSRINPNIMKPLFSRDGFMTVPYSRGVPSWSSVPEEKMPEFRSLCADLRRTLQQIIRDTSGKNMTFQDLVLRARSSNYTERGELPINLDGSFVDWNEEK